MFRTDSEEGSRMKGSSSPLPSPPGEGESFAAHLKIQRAGPKRKNFVRRGQLSRGQGANLFLWKARPHPNLSPRRRSRHGRVLCRENDEISYICFAQTARR